MKSTPTFVQGGKLLVGSAAIEAWKTQRTTCACRSRGDEENAISGSTGDMPAKWLGCDNCTGTAVGFPLVYRTESQISAKLKELHDDLPEVREAARMAREKSIAAHRERLATGWDGFQFVGVEEGKKRLTTL